jgi:GT2 family glycosyltransferase
MTSRRFTTASSSPTASFDPVTNPHVSVVIVTFGTGKIIAETLQSLASTTTGRAGGLDIEVIVVDNPHPKHALRSQTELSAFTRGVFVIQPDTNLGFGGGCELGAAHARGEYLAFVNPDITFAAGWLQPLVDALNRDDAPSIVAPVLINEDGTVQETGQQILANGHTRPNLELSSSVDPLVNVDYSSAACWVIRRDEHERIGGFDPAYHPAYFEDVDLALRTRLLGGRCAVHTGVRVVHHQGLGTPESPEPAATQHQVLIRAWPTIAWTQPRG